MVLTVSFALASVTSSFLPPSPRGLKAHPTPGWADIASARLDTSNGCQDHTTSPSATTSFVCAPGQSLTKNRPAIASRAPTLPRPPHPALHVRDDRDTPLLLRRDIGINNADFSKSRSGIFFARGLDSDLSEARLICPTGSLRTNKRSVIHQPLRDGVTRGACHQARIRATRWLLPPAALVETDRNARLGVPYVDWRCKAG